MSQQRSNILKSIEIVLDYQNQRRHNPRPTRGDKSAV